MNKKPQGIIEKIAIMASVIIIGIPMLYGMIMLQVRLANHPNSILWMILMATTWLIAIIYLMTQIKTKPTDASPNTDK